MAEALRYIVDDSGEKTSVLVPLKVWEKLNNDYKKLQHKMAVFNSIQMGLDELKKTTQNGKQLQTLSDFLR